MDDGTVRHVEADPGPLTVSETTDGGGSILALSGELDLASADRLREAGMRAISDAGSATVKIDMALVGFIDSTGLGVLVGLRNAAAETGTVLLVENPSEPVAQLLRLSGLEAFLAPPHRQAPA